VAAGGATAAERPNELSFEPASKARTELEIVTAGADLPHRTQHGTIGGRQCSPSEIEAYLPVLKSELARYPAGFLEKVGVRRIVLAGSLTFDGNPWSGIPVFEQRVLYLDAVRGSRQPDYQARLFHHELFHLIDFADDGVIDSDADWAALNPTRFRYGPGGENSQSTGSDVFTMRGKTAGFVTGYCESALEEDKAELFSCLMVMGEQTRRRAEGDGVVRRKMELLRKRLDAFSAGSSRVLFDRPGNPS